MSNDQLTSENLDDETLAELIEFRRTTLKHHTDEGNKTQTVLHNMVLVALLELQERRKAEGMPVAWTDEQELRDVEKSGCGYLFTVNPVTPHADPRRVIKLYTAPPAPVVQEIDRKAIADKVYGKCCRIPGATFYNAAEFAIDEVESCRAAMLQAGNHTEQRLDMVDHSGDANKMVAGNSPVIGVDLASGPDRTVEVRYVAPPGYVMVPKKLSAENGAKSVLSGEFSETKFINCPECFGDDDCETCDGSGRIEITVPVTWTTIKAIWAKGVEHFAAAPQ